MPIRFELADGIFIEPTVQTPSAEEAAKGSEGFVDYAAVIYASNLSNFSVEVHDEAGGSSLATKGWNALWIFHLLSLACQAPCFSLYSVSDGEKPTYKSANRNLITRPTENLASATPDQLHWAKKHMVSFNELIACAEFSAAMRCYGNAHYLFDVDMKIMLIWAGIEGLLSVDAELSRRIALYAALMLDGTPDEKIAYFSEVKRAYSIRSQAVHGRKGSSSKLEEGYKTSSSILSRILARCVELGRVPSPDELDRLAVSQSLR